MANANSNAQPVLLLPNTAVTPGAYVLASITLDAKGRIVLAAGASTTGSGAVVLASSPTIQPSGDFVGLTIKGFSTSQASLIAKLQKSDGTGFFQVDSTGKVQIQGDQTVASLGAELLTDGDFATDPTAIWTFSSPWSWSSNKMAFAGTTGPIAAVSLNYGGTGYTAGDVITLTNGANDATLTVLGVSAGVVTSVSIANAGTACTVNASVAVTGGTGTGATFAITRLTDSASVLSQSPAIVATSVYQVVYTISSRTSGELLTTLGGTIGARVNANGTYTQVFTAADTTGLIFSATADFVGSIDDISLKLITTIPAQFSALNSDGTFGLEFRAGGIALSNSFAGYRSGFATITGSNNTAVGLSALQSNIAGNGNVGVGVAAMQNNTTGSNNTAVGLSALLNNVSGGSNVAVGGSVLRNNTTGGSNVAIGLNALRNNTTGGSNVGVGVGALTTNTTGTSNVGVGLNVLAASTVATGNTAVGASAGSVITTGINNVVIGLNAGLALKTGSSNTLLGAAAGATGLKLGSSNVFIGVNAGGLESGSSKLYIAATNTLSPLVWGDFASNLFAINGSFGVRTQNPTASADIVGVSVSSAAFGLKVKSTSAELITNTTDRDFSGANNWTGTNWATTAAAFLHTIGSTVDAVLANVNMTASQIVSGDMYKIVFTIASATAGTVTPKLGTAAGSAVGVNGAYTQWIVATANNSNLIFTPTTDFNGSIDTISVTRLRNIVTIANDGTIQLGTAITDKIGAYGVAGIAQRSGAAQTAVATTAATNSSPWGFSTQSQADAIVALTNELRAWAVAQGWIKGSA